MKNNKLGIILLVFGILIIIAGLLIFVINKSESTNNKKPIEEAPIGADSGLSPEEFYDWKTNLSIRTAEIVDETFNNIYTLDNNGEFTFTLYDLQTTYNKDLSEFNTDTITCDLQTSTIKVTKDEDGYIKEIDLNCTNSEE